MLWLALTSVGILTLASRLSGDVGDVASVDILFVTCLMGVAGLPLVA